MRGFFWGRIIKERILDKGERLGSAVIRERKKSKKGAALSVVGETRESRTPLEEKIRTGGVLKINPAPPWRLGKTERGRGGKNQGGKGDSCVRIHTR